MPSDRRTSNELKEARQKIATLEAQLASREARASDRMLDTLRRQARMADAMFDQAITSFVLLDRVFRFVRVNAAWCDSFQMTVEQFAGRSFPELFAQDSPQAGELLDNLREVVSRKKPLRVSARAFVFADQPERGTTYWDWVLQPILDERGEVEFLFFSAIDVTERKRAEDTIRSREAELNESQRVAQIGSWDWDAGTDTITWSPEYFRIYDLDPTQPTPNYADHLKVYAEESAARLDQAVALAMETGEPYAIELQLAEPDEKRRWILARGEAKRDAAGRILGLRGTAQNITERKRAEETLRASETRYRTIFDACADGILIADIETRALRYANPAACRLLGYPESELTTMSVADIHPRGDLQDVVSEFEAQARGEQSLAVDIPCLRRDGTTIYADVNTVMITIAGRSLNAGFFRDVTERKRAQQALRESEKKYRELFEESFDGLFITSPSGRVLDINRKGVELLGYDTKEQVQDLDLARDVYANPVDRQRILSMVNAQGSAQYDVEVKRRDGRTILAHCSLSAARDRTGVVRSYRGIIRDVTESRRGEQERLAHLRFVENIDRVNKALQGTTGLTQLMSDVLELLLAMFDCDRAWLVYPCDPDAPSWRVPMERTRPEFPGAFALGAEFPTDSEAARVFRAVLAAPGPVAFGPQSEHPLPAGPGGRFGQESQIAMAIRPSAHKPYMFGLHQCSRARVWEPEEIRLFGEVGRRLAVALTGVLAHHALMESERTRDLALRAGKIGVFELDLGRGHGTWSPETAAIWGIPGEFSGDFTAYCWAHTHPDDLARVHESFERLVRSQKEGEMEFRVVRPDGTTRWIRWVGQVFADKTEAVLRAVGVNIDVTERQRAEEESRRTEERKSVLTRIADIFLTVPDEQMYAEVLEAVLGAMSSPFGVFGFIREDGSLVLPSLTRDVWDQCQVSDKSAVFPLDTWGQSMWGRAIRERRALRSGGPFHTPDGHIGIESFLTVPVLFGTETIGLTSVANKAGGYTADDEDLLGGIAAFIAPILNARLQRDAEERRRKLAEEALRESEQKYRLLVTNANEGILIVQDDVIRFANPKALEMAGRSEEELVGVPFGDVIHPEDQRVVLGSFVDRRSGKKPAEPEPFRIVSRDGKVHSVQLTAAIVTWEGRSGTLCFLRDVTENISLEAQFRQAQKMEAVGRFAGGVAHDFNNMLLIINGYTEMALNALHDGDPVRDDLVQVHGAGERAAALTRQFLAFSRKQALAPEVLDVNSLVASIEKMLRRVIGEDVELNTVLEPSAWKIKADPGQIEQIVMNLATNARDAMPRGGRLTIETANVDLDEQFVSTHLGATPGPHLMLGVSDTGCGMDAETMSRVFEPFFTTKEKGKGTGLGLATVYGIVKQSGGSIWVYSEPGEGTTFKLYFPSVEDDVPEARPKRHVAPPGAGETVLVVEDEDASRKLVVQMLKRGGYNVMEARNGGEALLLSGRHAGPIDLLLTDVVMPKMDGSELARRLLEVRPGTQVLFMSGYADRTVQFNGLLDNGGRFLQKPFGAEALLSKIRLVLELDPRRRPTRA